jgi:hypothetical protein
MDPRKSTGTRWHGGSRLGIRINGISGGGHLDGTIADLRAALRFIPLEHPGAL